ncbi:cation diffusion facilitator family transporter [Demequina sp. NBRC 110053]|uniref:cation diffusion facilitator family transporter n=1 Tax=Demequina sp. NBRC 110053 TaxID=1570342 RepID=UPI0009FD3B46|nr:cation diffusion facilitator family transporter [Demequina sp. NBRC 110053]
MAAEGGTKAIVAALSANLGIGVTKFIAFALTGASSMLAEAIHSVVDSGNQLLLLVGRRKAVRAADDTHPFGYARNRYYYAFLVAVMLFTAGGLFSLFEAWEKWQDPEPLESWVWVPIVVLLVAMALEGASLRTAIKEGNAVRGDLGWLRYIRRSRSPEVPVILLEDTAALIGLTCALFGISMTIITGDGIWDAIGTALIGVLLIVVAVILARETTSLLMGESVTDEDLARIRGAFAASPLTDVIHLRTMHLGPDDVMIAAKVGVEHGATVDQLADHIDQAERLLREAVPAARLIFIEPDLRRTAAQGDSPASASAPSKPPKENP